MVKSLSHEETMMMTKESYEMMRHWLEVQNMHNYSHPVCEDHKLSMSKCSGCKEHEDGGFLLKQKLKQRIMDSLIIEPDPDNPGQYIIFQETNYFEDNEEVGSFKSSMLEESLKSSISAVNRAIKHNVLGAIDKHLKEIKYFDLS